MYYNDLFFVPLTNYAFIVLDAAIIFVYQMFIQPLFVLYPVSKRLRCVSELYISKWRKNSNPLLERGNRWNEHCAGLILGMYRVFIKYCVFEYSKIYSGLWPLSVSPTVSVCVHNGSSNTSTAAELAEFRKITTI